MASIHKVPGLLHLVERSKGDARVCVAVLDGPVDLAHPSLKGADLTVLPVLGGPLAAEGGRMSAHGTHVASLIFGQRDTSAQGIAPQCRGLIVPVFSDRSPKLSALDLTRGIEAAVEAGAHLINVSAGQLIDADEGDEFLQRAVALCQERDVLILAAVGNDRCPCHHLPAALPSVLAVGAMDDEGHPLEFSNWGARYARQGILAPGQEVVGAVPGGGVLALSGSSFATPIVTGAAALLLSLQHEDDREPSPHAVRAALLAGARPCVLRLGQDPGQCLAGRLDLNGAVRHLSLSLKKREPMSNETEVEAITASCACQGTVPVVPPAEPELEQEPALELETELDPVAQRSAGWPLGDVAPSAAAIRPAARRTGRSAGIAPSGPVERIRPSQDAQQVYALGTLGYDFGTEARRDTFKQLMPPLRVGETAVPANPYDARQMVDYLAVNHSEARALTWTLNLELTPIYAIEPVGPFGHHVYDVLRDLLTGEVHAEHLVDHIERVSIPGLLTGRTARLFSGQVVPIIEIENVRGMYGWRTNALIQRTIEALGESTDEAKIRLMLEGFLNRIYYDLRNLGVTSRDRALNFAATNAFQASVTFETAIGAGMELDTILVEKSPICRLDSDCWDVKLRFFDPENSRRAKRVFRFTIDVSDTIPVTLGEVRTWSEAS